MIGAVTRANPAPDEQGGRERAADAEGRRDAAHRPESNPGYYSQRWVRRGSAVRTIRSSGSWSNPSVQPMNRRGSAAFRGRRLYSSP